MPDRPRLGPRYLADLKRLGIDVSQVRLVDGQPPVLEKPQSLVTRFDLADSFMGLWQKFGAPLEPVREYRFHPKRKWRFDLAWPALLVACELEGGTWVKGAHSRGAHYASDCEKYSEAAALGWRLCRLTTEQLRTKPLWCVELMARTLNFAETVL